MGVSVAGFLIQLIGYKVSLRFMLNAPTGATSATGTSAFCFGGGNKPASPADICKNANTCSFSRRIRRSVTCPTAAAAFRANIMAAHQRRRRRRGDGPSRTALIWSSVNTGKYSCVRPGSRPDIKSPDFRRSGRSGKDADAEFDFVSS